MQVSGPVREQAPGSARARALEWALVPVSARASVPAQAREQAWDWGSVAASAEAISALEISMINLCDFL